MGLHANSCEWPQCVFNSWPLIIKIFQIKARIWKYVKHKEGGSTFWSQTQKLKELWSRLFTPIDRQGCAFYCLFSRFAFSVTFTLVMFIFFNLCRFEQSYSTFSLLPFGEKINLIGLEFAILSHSYKVFHIYIIQIYYRHIAVKISSHRIHSLQQSRKKNFSYWPSAI